MHDEALVVLPELLGAFSIEQSLLVGHSDGASIALIHASAHAGQALGLILEAPHVFVEDLSVASVARMSIRFETTDLRRRLSRHHGPNTDAMFRAWHDIWLLPAFRTWNIEDLLPRVSCPVLVFQGTDDEYGTTRQVEAIVSQVAGRVETLILDGCGHTPHTDEPARVLRVASRFINGVVRRRPGSTAPA